MTRNRLIILCSVMIFISRLWAGEQLPAYTVSYDSELTIASQMQQDLDGYLWLATTHGPVRYDGRIEKRFGEDLQDTTALINEHILDLKCASDNRVWMVTKGNIISVYDPHSDHFKNYYKPAINFHQFLSAHIQLSDNDSLVYVFSKDTLFIFDAVRQQFKNISTSCSPEIGQILQQRIRTILPDGTASLWVIAHSPVLYHINFDDNTIDKYPVPMPYTSNFAGVKNLSADRHKNLLITLWLGGVLRFNLETKQFSQLFPVESYTLNDSTKYICTIEDSYGNYWIGTYGQGLIHFNPYVDSDGEPGLSLYNSSGAEHTALPNNYITNLIEDRENNIWAVTDKGLAKLSRVSPGYMRIRLPDNKNTPGLNPDLNFPAEISCVKSTSDHKVYLSGMAGLYIYDSTLMRINPVEKVNQFLSSRAVGRNTNINDFTIVDQKYLWCVNSSILFRYDIQKDTVDFFIPSTKSRRLTYNEETRDLLVHCTGGLQDEGSFLIKVDQPQGKIFPHALNAGKDTLSYYGAPAAISMDNHVRLWSNYGKLNKRYVVFSDSPKEAWRELSALIPGFPPLQYPPYFFHDSEGNHWIYSKNDGLFFVDTKNLSFRHYTHNPTDPFSIPSLSIYLVREAPNGTLWLGTTDAGIAYYDKENDRFIRFGSKTGLVSDQVFALNFDQNNHMWFGSSRGLTQFNLLDHSFKTFPEVEGFWITGTKKNAFASFNNNVFIGTRSFLFIINTLDSTQFINSSKTIISDLKINNTSVSPNKPLPNGRIPLSQAMRYTSNLSLTHKDIIITFNFTHLSMVEPKQNKFAYFLEGLENDWNYVDNQNYATYTSLPPGEYTLRVRAANSKGIWSNQQAELNITVIPRFFQRWSFKIFVLLLIAAGIMLIFHLRTQSILARNRELEDLNKKLNEEKTEREKAEGDRARLISAIEQSIDGVVITDTSGLIQYINPAFERDSGYTKQELIGSSTKMLNSGKNNEKSYQKMWEMISRGDVWSNKMINRRKNGEFYTVAESISPVRNDRGQIINYVAVLRDITRQERVEQELSQVRKIQAIGTLAGGIAHDFNNLLSIIQLNAEMIADSLTSNHELHEDILEIQVASRRGKALVDQILTFSRKNEDTIEEIHLDAMIQNVITGMLRQTIPSTIQIETDLCSPAPIQANPTHIYQIMLNLATNARDAISGNGTVTISLKPFTLEKNDFAQAEHPKLKPGHYFALSVTDTGRGIPEELVERVFDPFFTTKEVGKGTGMGLSILMGIMQKYNSTIELKTQLLKGSEFTVYFPALE